MQVARWKVFAAPVLVLAFALLGSVTAHAQGSITGRVTAEGGEALPETRVILLGTSLFASTSPDGRFTLRSVPAGTHEVRVIRVGYQEQKKPITVAAGETATLDFVLTPVVVRLTEVVTTATGPTRRVELGNSIPNIDVATLTSSQPIANMNDLLTARAPGVQVTGNSFTGGGARVRIRGASSLNLTNDPIYVIDGVRMTSNPGSIFFTTGGTSPSRVGDINPEEIENIEIVKGPSAATLYGTDAANGVIVITTKRGRAGSARWTFYGEGGLIQDRNQYPTNYSLFGRTPPSTTTPNPTQRECVLSEVGTGQCIADSTASLNVFDTDRITPLSLGNRKQFGGQVSGGSDIVRYFVSGEGESEVGTFKLPKFERDRMNRQQLTIRDYMDRPNALGKISVRGNMNAAITPKLDVAVSTGFINLNQRFPLEANSTAGIGSQAFGGKGYIDTTKKVSYPNGSGEDAPLMGYRAYVPGQVFGETIQQEVNRFIGASNWAWRPSSWLDGRANIGLDFTSRNDRDVRRRGEGAPLNATSRLGSIGSAGTNISNFTVDLSGTATKNPLEWVSSKTTLGAQYVNYNLNTRRGSGNDLAPGTQTSGGGANQIASEATVKSKTLGVFVEEAVGLRDRLFLTGALRSDQNSAFGTDFQSVIYPKLSLSWILSDESFFPRYDWLNQFRLRSAYGASGRQPGANDAIRFFRAVRANIAGTDVGTVQDSTFGNVKLRPERATEFEAGFESRMFSQRVNVDLTYYNKLTKDALISALQPPSLGGAVNIQSNLGSTKNVGWELSVNSQLVNHPMLAWDATVSGSTNRNKLVSLGNVPPQVGSTIRETAGYPLFGYWQRKYTYADQNHDGFITLNELTVDDSATFVGTSAPKYQAILSTGVDLFSRALRIQTLFDYKGGHRVLNGTERIRCQSRINCEGTSKLGASLFEQARAVALREHSSQTQYGYMEDASFLRWRELSVNYTVGERFANKYLRARGGTLTLGARNLGLLWTRYTGTDPETDASAGDADDAPFEFQTISPASYLVLRLSLNF